VTKKKEPLFPHVPKGQPVERLPQTREGIKNFWVEQNPEGTWAIVEAFPGGTIRSPFKTKEEAIKREQDIGRYYQWRLKQVPSPQEKFPKQHEALKGLYPYIIAEYHDDGDLTVRELIPVKGRPGFNLGRLYVVTTSGEVFEETQLAVMTLPKTEGDPIRKFCCRICGECAPPRLLEEGKFLERISWLRHHYKEKHPSMWGKARQPAPKLMGDFILNQDRMGNIIITYTLDIGKSVFLQFQADKELVYDILTKEEKQDLDAGWRVEIRDDEPRATILQELWEVSAEIEKSPTVQFLPQIVERIKSYPVLGELTKEVCYDFRAVRSAVMRRAWEIMDTERVPFRDAIKRAWDEVKRQCWKLGAVI